VHERIAGRSARWFTADEIHGQAKYVAQASLEERDVSYAGRAQAGPRLNILTLMPPGRAARSRCARSRGRVPSPGR
jgi:hypothetical protein